MAGPQDPIPPSANIPDSIPVEQSLEDLLKVPSRVPRRPHAPQPVKGLGSSTENIFHKPDNLLPEPRPATSSPSPPAIPAINPNHDLVSVTRPVVHLGSREQVKQKPAGGPSVLPPASPTTIADTGLTLGTLVDLVLKELYVHGSLLGADIARHARLPFQIIDLALRFVKDQRCIEVSQGEMIGRISHRFTLTDMGRVRARESFENCRYVGPAPVPLNQYIEQCRRQTVSGVPCTAQKLAEAFEGLIIRPNLLDKIGPALASGRSIFIYGTPGNGKTTIAKALGRFLNRYCGDIYVPYAIQTENSIITMYDPILHHATDDAESTAVHEPQGRDRASLVVESRAADPRWRRIRRPVVITGGELTLEMLELQYNATSHFYAAPLHIKANGGVFLIDDFGRQRVSPRDLLNRWILPLEERIDYLTLTTGRKFSVPFEQLTMFSTNLDPADLVDDAFLRRMRHKIRIDPPDRQMLVSIFAEVCRQQQIPFDPAIIHHLYEHHYSPTRLPRSSDPRDLMEIVTSICRFRGEPIHLTEEVIADAASRFFYTN